ncbi:MAG: hypothetical protein MJ016_02350 [Victivallaceae bacterium]|nr:hypothetical protein [Victivallaceae bacterium]
MKPEKRQKQTDLAAALQKIRRSGIPQDAVADVLIRIYGFDAETARRLTEEKGVLK